jgi:pimeloyl-ACP methyl ester carboxylesterase
LIRPFVLALACTGVLIPALSAQQSAPGLTLQPCPVPGTALVARCGTLLVPEHYGRPAGRKIPLRVMLVPATGANPAADPIVPIPGGPGGTVISAAGGWARILTEALAERALLLVDPRGTGESGAIDCDLDNPRGHLGGYFRDFLPIDRVKACRVELEKRVDLTAYSTESIADDLEAVRAALEFPALNLYGVSGGTRQAQVYLARYPTRVRSMVLAGTVAPQFRMPLSYARDAQAAFDSLTGACRADSACQRAYPRFREDFDSVLRRLKARPARVAIPRPDGVTDTVIVTRDIFAEQFRTRFYGPGNAANLPYVVSRAAAGDFLPFAETVVPGRTLQAPDGIANGHFLAITCTEDVPRIEEPEVAGETANTFLGDYRIRQQQRACREWPKARLSPGHFNPEVRQVPTLFISGDADPVTPPRWADSAAKFLPNSISLVFHGGGHVPNGNACAMRLVSRFIATASPQGLDVACIKEYRRPPFVVR